MPPQYSEVANIVKLPLLVFSLPFFFFDFSLRMARTGRLILNNAVWRRNVRFGGRIDNKLCMGVYLPKNPIFFGQVIGISSWGVFTCHWINAQGSIITWINQCATRQNTFNEKGGKSHEGVQIKKETLLKGMPQPKSAVAYLINW